MFWWPWKKIRKIQNSIGQWRLLYHVFPCSLLFFHFSYHDAKIHGRQYKDPIHHKVDSKCCILCVFYQILLNIGVSCYLYRSSKEVLQMLPSCKVYTGYIGGCAATDVECMQLYGWLPRAHWPKLMDPCKFYCDCICKTDTNLFLPICAKQWD